MLSRTAQRSKLIVALAHSMSGASARPNARGAAPPQAQIGFCFRLDGLHATGLVSYAFDAKLTTKQALGEAARVRRDPDRAQRLDENFTLWQRVKLRLAEPVDALL